MSLSIYSQLYQYTLQLTGDVDESHKIVRYSIDVSSALIGTRTSKDLHALMIVNCRNKSYEWNAKQERETRILDYAAKALELPIGMVRQAVRAIREGRYLDA